MNQEWMMALLGGAIIGVAVSFLLILNGRVTGISGIVNSILFPIKGDFLWRLLFIVGLFLGGVLMNYFRPADFQDSVISEKWTTIVAGLLVGFGTLLGSGCTSGHGVCGLSRLSLRSLIATLCFILAGIFAVFFFKKLGVLL